MKNATATRLARTVWGLSVAMIAVQTTMVFASGFPNEGLLAAILFVVLTVFSAIAFATVGLLIVARQPGNRIGWLFLGIGFTFALLTASGQYASFSFLHHAGTLPATIATAWIQRWTFIPMVGLAIAVFLLYPNGRLPTSRWRWAAWLTAIGTTVTTVCFAITPGRLQGGPADLGASAQNPFGVQIPGHLLATITQVGGLSILIAALASFAAIAVRFRRSSGVERQQIRWLLTVGATFLFLWIGSNVLGGLVPYFERAGGDFLFLLYFGTLAIGIPVASAIAILKYRLYSLDLVIRKAVVFGVIATAITLIYLLLVVAIPTVIVGAGGSNVFDVFSFTAAVLVALTFNPVRSAARRLADRLVYGGRATPYEVLADFSGTVGEAYAADDVLPRMAEVLGKGTGADSAVVWLRVGHSMRREASWPADDGATELPDDATEVRHGSELLGALSVQMPASDPMNPGKAKLVDDLAAQAGLVLRNVRLIEELRASRQRLVAAQDEERRKIERNLHDGAQQQLIALTVKLRLAQGLATKDPDKSAALLEQIQGDAQDSIETLRDLARGIYPPLLADKGLTAALDAQARKASFPVDVEAMELPRYPREIEAAIYFCTLEALQNVAKYADASRVEVRLSASDGDLSFVVTDDGQGFDAEATSHGTGLQGMSDRLDAIGGRLEVRSSSGEGTTVTGSVPAQPVPD